jgi:hypothetical protein
VGGHYSAVTPIPQTTNCVIYDSAADSKYDAELAFQFVYNLSQAKLRRLLGLHPSDEFKSWARKDLLIRQPHHRPRSHSGCAPAQLPAFNHGKLPRAHKGGRRPFRVSHREIGQRHFDLPRGKRYNNHKICTELVSLFFVPHHVKLPQSPSRCGKCGTASPQECNDGVDHAVELGMAVWVGRVGSQGAIEAGPENEPTGTRASSLLLLGRRSSLYT